MKQNISNLVCAPAKDGDVGAGSGGVAGTLSQAKQTVAQTARDTAAKIKTTASDTAARAKEEAQRLVQEKKETAANRVGGYSSALHESAKTFEEQDPNIAWFAHQAADRLQSVADYVRNRDFAALRQDAEGLARRHPAAFFGGLFVAGLVLGSVLTASRRNTEDDSFATNDDLGADEWAEGGTQGTVQTNTDFPGASAAGI